MFDFGFSELAIIGTVALVVLGPERLPTVAKTAGQLIGKAQRMVQQVKTDFEKETALSELKNLKEEAQNIARDLQDTVKGQADSIQKEFDDIRKDVEKAGEEIQKAAEEPGREEPAGSGGGLGEGVQQDTQPASTSKEATGLDYDITAIGEEPYDYWDQEPVEPEVQTRFEKRYHSGPSIDELAEQLERLKAELGDRSPRLKGGGNRRLAARARNNRVRIYR